MTPRTILVPTDFSETAEHGTRYALELAKALGAKVHLLNVYTIPVPPEGGGLAEQFAHDTKHDAQARLAKCAEGHHSDVLEGKLLATGDPSDAIVSIAKEIKADLIVIGTHGRRGVQRMLLGSVAETVLRVAPCPVLAIRSPEPKA